MKSTGPVFGLSKGLKMQTNSKNCEQRITNFAKTQISEAIKNISFYLTNKYFLFQFLFIPIQLKLCGVNK